jgi:hypothetical protein
VVEDSLLYPFEVLADSVQRCYTCINSRELLLDRSDDPLLFRSRWDGQTDVTDLSEVQPRASDATDLLRGGRSYLRRVEGGADVAR